MSTGRKPGRPPDIGRRVRVLCQDAALTVADRLVGKAKLGDVAAADLVLRLALAPAQPKAVPTCRSDS